jgi:hypothetical protein
MPAIEALCKIEDHRATQALLLLLVPPSIRDVAKMRLCDEAMYQEFDRLREERGDVSLLGPLRAKVAESSLSKVPKGFDHFSEGYYPTQNKMHAIIQALQREGEHLGSTFLSIVQDRPAELKWYTVEALGYLAGSCAARYLATIAAAREDLRLVCFVALAAAGCPDEMQSLRESLGESELTLPALRFLGPIARVESADLRRECLRTLWTTDSTGPSYDVSAVQGLPAPVAVRAIVPLVWQDKERGSGPQLAVELQSNKIAGPGPRLALEALTAKLRSPEIKDVLAEDLEDITSRGNTYWYVMRDIAAPDAPEPWFTSETTDLDCSEVRELARRELERRRRGESGESDQSPDEAKHVIVTCACGKRYRVPVSPVKRMGSCKACGRKFAVPPSNG